MNSQAIETHYQAADFKSELKPIWCKGCGNFSILSCIQKALAETDAAPHETAVISGIGCSSRLPGYCETYSFNSIHGRALPIATGVKLAHPELTVIAAGGDGDGLSIGGGHLPHAGRRNVDLTYILMDNEIYGLTKGQASPTSQLGDVTKSSPYGVTESPLDAVTLALAYNVSYVARAYVGNGQQMTELIAGGIRHKGFALIHVMLPCPTFRGMDWYKELKGHFAELDGNHDPLDRMEAMRQAAREDGKMAMGLFYQCERPTLEHALEGVIENAQSKGPGKVESILDQFAP